MFDKEFYPTPLDVLELMQIDCNNKIVLEPSAGKGDIVDYLLSRRAKEVVACEKNTNKIIMENKYRSKIELHNVDCLTFMKQCEDKQFDLAIVDPPYGIGESSNNNKSRSKLAKAKDYGCKNWDDNSPDKEYFIELKRISKNQIIWGANHFIEKIPNANSSCWVVWDKVNGDNDFADCELAYCSFKTSVRKLEFKWHGMLQQDMKNKEVRIHPTQKPVALYKWLLDKYAEQGQTIFDSHLGSGSIAVACDDLGFDLTACEIDKEYFDMANKRIQLARNQTTIFDIVD